MTSKIDLHPQFWDRLFAPSSSLAVVTTVDREGRTNAAPFGTCTRVCHDPVYIAFTVGAGKDTYHNVLHNHEFVVNLPSFERTQLEKVWESGQALAHDVDELAVAGLTAISSNIVGPPRIAEYGRHFECRVEWTKEWLHRLMVVGRVLAASCTPGLIDPQGYLVWEAAAPVHYCGAQYGARFVAAYQVMDLLVASDSS